MDRRPMTQESLLQQRDAKIQEHLAQYAPVWLVDETYMPEEDAQQFHVIFHHFLYGWVRRRYQYDGFNDTLYHKGQTVLDEEQALSYQSAEPYQGFEDADVPNAYGG